MGNTVSNIVDAVATLPCTQQTDYALGEGRQILRDSFPYSKTEELTGVSLQSATAEDFQRLFKCTGYPNQECSVYPDTCSVPPCDVCGVSSPTTVTVDGYNLRVNGEIFHINGVCWSPVPSGGKFGNELYSEWGPIDIPKMKAAGMNAIRPYQAIVDFEVLDYIHEQGMMVTVPISPGAGFATEAEIKETVNRLKNHPAVLMWTLGNEWNLNTFYNKDLTVDDCVEWIRMASRVIKENDPNHPVATVYGDVPPRFQDMVPRLPDIDVWSMNAYRFDTFNGLFEEWKAANINKPIFLGEFGADAWDASASAGATYDETSLETSGGRYNPEAQSEVTTKLLGEIYQTSTKTGTDVKVNSGGFIFEWSDEYWKRGAADVQDTDGLAPCPGGCGPAPDRSWNEDFWGLATMSRADSDYAECGSQYDATKTKCPLRPAYYAYKDAAKP